MSRIPLNTYFEEQPPQSIFLLRANPEFSPIDFNLEFLKRRGWSLSSDRFRFHTQQDPPPDTASMLVKMLASQPPHILLRRLDKEEGYFVTLSIYMDGSIKALGNDSDVLQEYVTGLFTEFPPSFQQATDLKIEAEESTDTTTIAMFCGMLHGAYGWDPASDLPPSLEESLKEAQTSLGIGNYRSCVVMCRRGLEGLLKFAYERLLGKKPVNKKGRGLMLNDLITGFRSAKKIPEHMLHAADSLRTLGNVPGAHAADIEGYQFTRYDAEFALSTFLYFNEQYFTKVDADVRTYYSITIDTE